MGPQTQWVQSQVTDDKIYCTYIAPNQEMIRQHAEQGGFPANRISEVRSVIDPTTAEVQPSRVQRGAVGPMGLAAPFRGLSENAQPGLPFGARGVPVVGPIGKEVKLKG